MILRTKYLHLLIMVISQLTIFILTNIIKNTKRMSVGRKLSYDIEHYVEVVLNVLNTGQQWNTLQCPLHYSTYHKHFMNWVNTGIITELFTLRRYR